MRYWKFVCRSDTEGECFLRRLFGDTEDYKERKPVKKGDLLFLYNIETGILYGPFVAETDARFDIEPDAWNGRFRWQVRVGWNIVFKLSNAQQNLPFIQKLEFSKEEADQILKTLEEKGIKIETPPLKQTLPTNLLNKIRELDEEIHRLAHRIEECRMAQRRHPADKEIDLYVLKAELCAKMRDFVWAIRKLDKLTGIMELPSNRKG